MAVSEEIDIVESDNSNLQAEAPLGEVLSAARIAKRLTQQDVSNNLRFSIKQIDALENNAFDVLPDAMITRGFIRNYARFLELDAEPLLASYRGRVPDKSPNTLTVQSSMRQVKLTEDNQPWLKYILGSILVLLFLLAWFLYMDHQPQTVSAPVEKVPEPVVEVKPPAEIPLPEIALPAAERQMDETGASVSDVEANVANPAVAATTPQLDTSLSTDGKKEADPIVPSTSQLPLNTPVDSSKKSVSMSFTGETWVSVTDKSGKVIFEKRLAAGSTDSFDGTPPFNLVIGNAKATKLVFAGQEVDLTAHTRSNVARVRLE